MGITDMSYISYNTLRNFVEKNLWCTDNCNHGFVFQLKSGGYGGVDTHKYYFVQLSFQTL